MNARAFAFLAALLAVVSCAPNRSSLSIQASCYPTEDCTFGETCDLQFIGAYKVAAGQPLRVYLQVANRLADNGDLTVGRVNSNDAHVTGGIVEFTDGASGSFSLDNVANQWIPAGGGAVIGVSVLFPASATANISLTGYYDNGNDFETGPFPLSVEVAAIPACTGTQSCPPLNGAAGRTQIPSVCL